MRRYVDLNADVGEGCGNDEALFEIVTSANVACGVHAGDDATMRATTRAALERGVAIGAHPSFPDRENFGRSPMRRTPHELYGDVTAQLRALAAIVWQEGAELSHVKAHGALYTMAWTDDAFARPIAEAVRDFNPKLALFAPQNSRMQRAAKRIGLRTVAEVFADRRYTADGRLVPRSENEALIEDSVEAVEQTLAFIDRGAQSVCIHGDGPNAVQFALRIRAALEKHGIRLRRAQPSVD